MLEHARVQALGGRSFPGVALNLAQHFLKKATSISEPEMLEGLAFVRLVAKPMPSALAYDWVCKRRIDYSHNSDIWDLRWNWQEIK